MMEQARRLNPGIEFRQGNMLSLDVEDGAWGGIVAFYSIIHLSRSEITAALTEMKRALCQAVCCFSHSTSAMRLCIWMNGGDSRCRWTSTSSVPTRWRIFCER